jgi:hypothetical protein
MSTARHARLTALLARLDQQIAEAEALTVEPADDDTLQRVTATLAELREAREDVEGKPRTPDG